MPSQCSDKINSMSLTQCLVLTDLDFLTTSFPFLVVSLAFLKKVQGKYLPENQASVPLLATFRDLLPSANYSVE